MLSRVPEVPLVIRRGIHSGERGSLTGGTLFLMKFLTVVIVEKKQGNTGKGGRHDRVGWGSSLHSKNDPQRI